MIQLDTKRNTFLIYFFVPTAKTPILPFKAAVVAIAKDPALELQSTVADDTASPA